MKNLRVDDKYRTNPLSHVPGDYTVTVVYSDGMRFIYDKIKKPGWYVKHIENEGKNRAHGVVVEVWVDSAKVWDSQETTRNPWDIQNS